MAPILASGAVDFAFRLDRTITTQKRDRADILSKFSMPFSMPFALLCIQKRVLHAVCRVVSCSIYVIARIRFLPRSPSSQSFTNHEITRKSVDLRQGYLHDFPVSLCHLIGHHIPVMFMVVLMSACRMSFRRTANRVPTASSQERYVWRTPTAMGKCCNGSMSGIAGYIRVKENPKGQPTDLYGIDQFTYGSEENCYICPGRQSPEIYRNQ